MSDYLYVHLDSTNNSVVTKGITHHDFCEHLVHPPKNLLLLDPYEEAGHFESHTGLKIIENQGESELYLASLRRRKEQPGIKWLDYSELGMLKQLTPQEIAELLYFGHMKMHLRSPFFYKLQNNFAYFELNEELNRVYYRYMEEFYFILGKKITKITTDKVNEKKSFFRRNIPVTELTVTDMKALRNYFLEGTAFLFKEGNFEGKTYTIPLYILEDRLQKANDNLFEKMKPVAFLIYHINKKTWELKELTDFYTLV